ncbi:hypothetical protein TrLO_g12343 [Triparma laevis f. longispina]|uniref:Uncharacterized protein n=1 Tax=Triparma laevis f. longispina TaxID=1714387 RepID=A0A9W7FUX4_9STRA|nr:hypothetical protein TrLO_g12343 [Triparma laevis f. longispina]
MEMSMNSAVSAARLEKHGYSKFFQFQEPISSYSSWTEKQINNLQVLLVDSLAQAKIAEYSEECPVVYPLPASSVKLYDCFWYIDVKNDMQCPMLYQVTDITEKKGVASCRLIILEIPPAAEKSVGDTHIDGEKDKEKEEEEDVLGLGPPAPPTSDNTTADRSRLYNLGETLRLELRKIVRCPKLNQRGFQMLGQNGVRIKSEVEDFEVDFGAFLGAGESTTSTFDSARTGSLEEVGFDDDDDEDEESDEDLTFTMGSSCNVRKVEEVVSRSLLDESVDSDTEETSKLFEKKTCSKTKPKVVGYIDPSVKLSAKKGKNSKNNNSSASKKKEQKKVEKYKQVKRINNIAETTITKKPSVPIDITPRKTVAAKPSEDVDENKENVPITTPNTKGDYEQAHYSEDSLDTSPTTVCITFVQSRHTKIQYHDEVEGASDDEDDEFGDFKSAVGVKTAEKVGADMQGVKMNKQAGFSVVGDF